MERLTEPEEEAMQVLWQLNGGFIKDVLEQQGLAIGGASRHALDPRQAR